MKSNPIPATKEQFTEKLADLIFETEASGVDLEGGYTLRNDGDQRDLEVQIVRLASQQESGDE
ncbi:hypothetical protein [Haloarchaeobius sp. DT45]|uniref:hypothetical protein n=1 Tax=Haloarchaeobius sp. DT45 TaxID=3446116 RepID=UPI003F6A8BEE